MKTEEKENVKKKPKAADLVKSMLTVLPMMTASDKRITQERVATAIGCHRHWFRKHKARYNSETGLSDDRGSTPLEILETYEEERNRERVNTPLEVALQNADAKVNQQRLIIKALEEKLEAQRALLHLISINRHRLGISDKELFRKPVD